jgi:antitoxin HicB
MKRKKVKKSLHFGASFKMKKLNTKSSSKFPAEDELLLDESKAEMVKRTIVFQIELELKRQKITKTELAKKMKTSRAALNRLLDPRRICTLKSLVLVAIALEKHLEIKFT